MESKNLQWKEIQNFNNYEVSNLGQIRNKKTGRILKEEIINNKYYRVIFSKNGIVSRFLVHHIVAKHFLPNPENKNRIKHKGDFGDNSADNQNYI